MESERHIGNIRIWVNDQEKPIPTGTFDWLHKETDPFTEHRLAVFRKYNQDEGLVLGILNEATYDPQRTPVYIEVEPDTTFTSTGQREAWPKGEEVRVVTDYRRPHPDLYYGDFCPLRFDDHSKVFPFDLVDCYEENHQVVFNRPQMQQKGFSGFYIENAGFKTVFSVDHLIVVVFRPAEDIVTFCSLNEQGEPQAATYRISKITRQTIVSTDNSDKPINREPQT